MPSQIRRRTIIFYCCDGTLSVSEPEQENTGLVQGCIFKRQKVTMPPRAKQLPAFIFAGCTCSRKRIARDASNVNRYRNHLSS
jgi:hypothetical protein